MIYKKMESTHVVHFRENLDKNYIRGIIDELFKKQNNDFVIYSKENRHEISFFDNTFEFSKIEFNDYDSFAEISIYLLEKHSNAHSSKSNSLRNTPR